jgi:hypothetical protein
MKVLAKTLLAVGVIVGLMSVATATTDTATSTVTITFSEISELAVSGDPATLTIVAPAVAGDLPADQTVAGTTMAWTSNVAAGQTRKITGSIASLFAGIDLWATVAAAGGSNGTSGGELRFTAAAPTAYEFVTGIGNCNTSGQTITFRANVTSMVAPYTDTAKVVTWTLTEDAV